MRYRSGLSRTHDAMTSGAGTTELNLWINIVKKLSGAVGIYFVLGFGSEECV